MSDLKSVTKSKNSKTNSSSKPSVKNQSKNDKQSFRPKSEQNNKVINLKQKAMLAGNHHDDTNVETYTDFQISTVVHYVESESQPESNFHFFSYKIKISNVGNTTAQLMSRHWIITDGHGQSEEVRGPGVVGLQPKINPGQSFEYESACPLNTSCGTMKGSYQMVAEDGQSFEVEIPEFYLVAPTALH